MTELAPNSAPHSPIHPSHIGKVLPPAPGALQELYSSQRVTCSGKLLVLVPVVSMSLWKCFVAAKHLQATLSSCFTPKLPTALPKRVMETKTNISHHSIAWKALSEVIKPKPRFCRSLKGQAEVTGDVIPIKSPFSLFVCTLLRLLEQCL